MNKYMGLTLLIFGIILTFHTPAAFSQTKAQEKMQMIQDLTGKNNSMPESYQQVQNAQNTQKQIQQLKPVDVSDSVKEVIAHRGTAAQKHIETMESLKKLEELRQTTSRFKTLNQIEIPLKNSKTFKVLKVTVMAELEASLASIESLFAKYKESILTTLKSNLEGMNDKQLYAEKEEKNILNMTRDTINKESGEDFIENLYYTTFTLE